MIPVRVGLVGTGYAAKVRAEALQADARSHLVAVAGHTPETTQAFSQTYQAEAVAAWEDLVARADLDLIVICNVNRDHGAIAHAALQTGKHVVVEYPLSLEVSEAETLIQLAARQGKLLHVEHIELLSGIHLAIKEQMAAIGTPFYVRYTSLNPQHPAPQKWTYHRQLFGFPLIGALSRLHRLTDLFGQVSSVSCQARFWENAPSDFYTTCICTAQLRFVSGLVAEVIYGKGEALWQGDRTLHIHGERGALLVDGEQGKLVTAQETLELNLGSRRGLFAKDTDMVLDYLTTGAPLYITPERSLQSLRVADAARRSAETGQTIELG
ncbi:MAG TPA: Gfo/Idh/MocA family oxidoreductase [Coleofasciculaceae cyanobacterium]